MKYPKKLTFKSARRLINNTTQMYVGKDKEGKKKYVQLRQNEAPQIEPHPGTIYYAKHPEHKKWKNI